MRRFDAIVHAAAESFAELGFAETTMEGIAARAETSIGSVYRFFPNKRAVFREMALRCIDASREHYAELLGPEPLACPWNQLLERFIDGFRRFHAQSVEMQAMWRNLELYGEYAEDDIALLRELADATAGLFAGWMPDVEPPRRRVVAAVVVNTMVSTLLMVSREEDPAQGDAIVRESKMMLIRYLREYLGDPVGEA